MTLATYGYDVFGDRIEKDVWTHSSGTTTTTRFAYDLGDSSPSLNGLGSAGSIWSDLNSSNGLLTRYIFGDAVDQMVARISSSGTAAWYLTDRLGSVRDITDNTGAVIDHVNYDGFGNVTSETQPTNGDRFKWTGRELDSETGLQYNRARYYDPKTGRWISQDPVGLGAGDGNLYRYVTNDTPNSTDPSGLWGPNPGMGYSLYLQGQRNYAYQRTLGCRRFPAFCFTVLGSLGGMIPKRIGAYYPRSV
jgi:RHS repeat-associated protein